MTDKARRYIPDKACLACGGPIPWRDGIALREKAKFCGNPCKRTYQSVHPPRPKIERSIAPCASCGEPVSYLPSQRGLTRKNPRIPKKLTPEILAECRRRYADGKGETMTSLAAEFGVSVSGMSIGIRQVVYGDNIYCSRKCWNAGHSKAMTGRRPSNGVYTSHHTFRTIIRQEFYDRCSLCGWDEAPCDVAHIIARKTAGAQADTLENVTMLCPNHHRMFDCGLIPVEVVRMARLLVLKSDLLTEHQSPPP